VVSNFAVKFNLRRYIKRSEAISLQGGGGRGAAEEVEAAVEEEEEAEERSLNQSGEPPPSVRVRGILPPHGTHLRGVRRGVPPSCPPGAWCLFDSGRRRSTTA